MSDTTCIHCDESVDPDDAFYGSGSMDASELTTLEEGDSVDADDLFAFDDGPYCSLDCLMDHEQ